MNIDDEEASPVPERSPSPTSTPPSRADRRRHRALNRPGPHGVGVVLLFTAAAAVVVLVLELDAPVASLVVAGTALFVAVVAVAETERQSRLPPRWMLLVVLGFGVLQVVYGVLQVMAGRPGSAAVAFLSSAFFVGLASFNRWVQRRQAEVPDRLVALEPGVPS